MFLIDEENALGDFVGEMERDPPSFITVDTEFMRENLEKPLLCLVQIATQDGAFIVDPMAVDISPLGRVFEHSQIKKVFHSAFQDVEILSLHGINTVNFYDTQLYEAILSTNDSISYQAIVFRYLNEKIEKKYSLSNWRKRPLSEKQLTYSINDVLYLRDVYGQQLSKLMTLGREHWLDEELEQIKNKYDNFAQTLSENNLSIYNQLREWQVQKAAEQGVAPELVVKNDIIKSICKRGVDFVHRMKNSRNIKGKHYREFWLFAEKIAEQLEIREKSDEQNGVVSLLKTLLKICSQKHSVAASMIATTSDLERLIGGDANVKCLSGWRMEVFGEEALRLLNGEISLGISGAKVVIGT
jgi:ribonuclease D